MISNETITKLHGLYLRDLRNRIRLKLLASTQANPEEVENLRAERRGLEADISSLVKRLGKFADITRLGAYVAFIKSSEGTEAEMAKRDYAALLGEIRAKMYYSRSR